MPVLTRPPRNFVPEDFTVTDWEHLQPWFEKLLEREIDSVEELEQWMKDKSELECVVNENAYWRSIKLSCDTENEEKKKAYEFFTQKIYPSYSEWSDKLTGKFLDCLLINYLDSHTYKVYIREMKLSKRLYRKENLPLKVEQSALSSEYGNIAGAMMVEIDGEEKTLQQAGLELHSLNRDRRQMAYETIWKRRGEDKEKLNKLFDDLRELRVKIAENANCDDYREYAFLANARFDYTPADCVDFHEGIKKHVVPLVGELQRLRKEMLGVDVLKPWDLSVGIFGGEVVKPFTDDRDLIEKTKKCLGKLDPQFSTWVETMDVMGHLDLGSRKGKRPGGYMCNLPEVGVPFIFANTVGTQRDLETMVHECGHAFHNFLIRDLPLKDFKEYSSEIAEVASMSMELLSMEYWDVFYPSKEDLLKAQFETLEGMITIIPWIAIIDTFQHWIYTNPDHTVQEREEEWKKIFLEFDAGVVEWDEEILNYRWQAQLHLYEHPFYYIEYGIAQLGAIGVWRNFTQNPQRGLELYKKGLSLGNTRPLPELFEACGVKFDFSPKYIHELMDFTHEKIKPLKPSKK